MTCKRCEQLEAELHTARSEAAAHSRLLKRIAAWNPNCVREIVHICADEFLVGVRDLMARNRTSKVTLPRWVAMLMLRRHLSLTFCEIGEVLNKDHGTVMYGLRQLDGPCIRKADQEKINRIDAKVRQMIAGGAL